MFITKICRFLTTLLSNLRLAGTGRCSYRVRDVDGSCAKHLIIKFYTVVMLLTVILIIILKTAFYP